MGNWNLSETKMLHLPNRKENTHMNIKGLINTNNDKILDIHLDMWSGLPNSGTLVVLHMPQVLGIPSISDLYKECHHIALISTRMKGDPQVNHCLVDS